MADISKGDDQSTASGGSKDKDPRSKALSKTEAKKEARAMMTLQDKFGDSPIALGEPSLFEVPARAIECARQIVKRTLRSNKGFQPSAVANNVANVCQLDRDQKKRIRDWLDWLNIRTWVLTQADRSPVIAWLNTNPNRDEKWSQALHDEWVEQINASWRKGANGADASFSKPKQATPRQAPTPAGSETPVSHSNVVIPRSRGNDRQPSIPCGDVTSDSFSVPVDHVGDDLFDQRPRHQFPRPADEKQSPPLLAQAKEDLEPRNLDIPPVEPKYFRKGHSNLNKFFNAIKPGSEPQIRAAAQILADDPQIFEEICSVSQDHRRFVGAVFAALEMSIPGSDQ